MGEYRTPFDRIKAAKEIGREQSHGWETVAKAIGLEAKAGLIVAKLESGTVDSELANSIVSQLGALQKSFDEAEARFDDAETEAEHKTEKPPHEKIADQFAEQIDWVARRLNVEGLKENDRMISEYNSLIIRALAENVFSDDDRANLVENAKLKTHHPKFKLFEQMVDAAPLSREEKRKMLRIFFNIKD